jgi:hypothetical protein
MAMKAAFLVIVPDADPEKHRTVLSTDFVDLIVQMVANMDQALEHAVRLADEGCSVIEMCAGFGNSMTGKIADAVRGKAMVGSVRFDIHAALGMSSDEVFGK